MGERLGHIRAEHESGCHTPTSSSGLILGPMPPAIEPLGRPRNGPPARGRGRRAETWHQLDGVHAERGGALTGDQRPGAAYRLLLMAGARASAAALGFLAALLIARAFDPAALGTWGMSLAVQGWALHLGELGLRSAVTREAARRPDTTLSLLARYLPPRLLASALVVAAVVVGAAVLAPDSAVVVGLVTLAILPAALQLDWIPLAQGREGRAAALLIARPAAFVLLFLLVPPDGLIGLAALFLGAWTAAAVVTWRDWPAHGPPAAIGSRTLIRRGAPLCGVTCLNQAQLGLDLLAVGATLGATAAGPYWLASQIAVAGLVVANAANQLALARLAPLEGGAFGTALTRELRTVTAAGIAVAVLLAAAAPLTPLLFGATHAGAGYLLLWLLPWLVLQHPTALLQGALAARGQGGRALAATAIGAATLVAGLIVALRSGSPEAFAVARAAAEAARLAALGLALAPARTRQQAVSAG